MLFNQFSHFCLSSCVARSVSQTASLENMKRKILFLNLIGLVLLWIQVSLLRNFVYVVHNPLEVAGWSPNTSRETVNYILPNENTALIEPPTLCRKTKPIFLLIVVCSTAKNFQSRQTIRETWGNSKEFNYPMFYQFHGSYNKSFLQVDKKYAREYFQVRRYS